MANEKKYFSHAFAENGNTEDIPDQASGGLVDLESGFGPDYEKLEGVAGRKLIGRTVFNGVMKDTTENIKQWQEKLYPTWIEDAGAGVPFSYSAGVIVNHNGQNWIADVANVTEPGIGSQWSEYKPGNLSVNGDAGKLNQSYPVLQNIVSKNEDFISEPVSASTESTKLPNGLIMKFGDITVQGDSSATVTFSDAFPGGCIQAQVSLGQDFNTGSDAGCAVYNLTRTNCKVEVGTPGPILVRWFAIGY